MGFNWQDQAQRVLRVVNSRKVWVVHPSFQLRVVGFGAAIAACALLLTYLAIQFFFWKTESVLMQVGTPGHHPVWVFIQGQRAYLGWLFLMVALLSLSAATVFGVMFSHRVAGPIHRMRQHLLEAAGGRAPRMLQFREDDYFQELAEAYNAELLARGRVRRPGSEPNREAQLLKAKGEETRIATDIDLDDEDDAEIAS